MSTNTTWIQVPSNIKDEIVLKRFLSTLVEQLDIVFSNRYSSPFALQAEFKSISTSVLGLRSDFNNLGEHFVLKNSSNLDTKLTYQVLPTIDNDRDIPDKKYVDDKIAIQPAPVELASDATNDEIIDKINELILALKGAKIFN